MNDILNRIYGGALHPEEENIPHGELYLQRRREAQKAQEALFAKLDEAMRREFTDMMEKYTLLTGMECEHSYVKGMQLGAQLALELTGWKADAKKE